jgi:hypothetical protein
MGDKTRFPFFRWVFRNLTGRSARTTYLVVFALVLVMTTVFRVRSYLMTRKIQSVLRGLAELRIDQTSEEQLLKIVPHLAQTGKEWRVESNQHGYYATISNESDGLVPQHFRYSWMMPEGGRNALSTAAYWLGYRFIRFDASVLVEDGRVTRVMYGLGREWAEPRPLSYIVSVKSVHSLWMTRQIGFWVSSTEDESPQYRPGGGKDALGAIFTNDAPAETTKRAFQLDLDCFWNLRGCDDVREIAPLLWQDVKSVQSKTYQQLISGKCPDSIIEGRMKYLPDLSILLLEVTGSRRVEVNEEGYTTEDWFTDYKLKEVIRGREPDLSWKNVRLPKTIPSPSDPKDTIGYPIWPQTKVGTEVLFFGNMKFSSCRIVPATQSTLDIVRKTPVPPKRPEDEIVFGLM